MSSCLQDRLLACKGSDVFSGVEELYVASIEDLILREFHRSPDKVAVEVRQVALAVQVPLLCAP